ncbi:MAG: hypothetical protein HY673_10945 [Chloroflexi bacterium]|nr:hypothetical protein [Chloroflexota bacterium]
MKTKKGRQPGQAEYALALAAYRDEQERIKLLLRRELDKYGRPAMSLAQVRSIRDRKLAGALLSQLIVEMRKEGH